MTAADQDAAAAVPQARKSGVRTYSHWIERHSLFQLFLSRAFVKRNRQDGLRYLSHLFSAPVLATPIFLVLAALTNSSLLPMIVSIVFATTIPIFGIVYFARSKRIDFDIPERRARTQPFMVAIGSYLLGFAVLTSLRAPILLSGLMLAYCINTSVMFLVTRFWKISVHAAGVTGPLSFLVFRLGIAWSLLYLLVIPVGLMRIRLGQHTLPQIVAGAILSAALTWIQIIFLLPLFASTS